MPTDDLAEIGGRVYVVKVDHRDGTKVKSQWTIPVHDEQASFELGVTSGWVDDERAWGLHLRDGVADYLGLSAVIPGPIVQLPVAFFQLDVTCHGYPSDPKRSVREIPPEAVRKDWLSKGYLRSAVIRKIGRGLTCKL